MTANRSTFVYCPRSGSRVLAHRAVPGLVLVTWVNGSVHVLGGIHLTYPATGSQAAPRAYWRQEAHAVAVSIVEAVGGIAWDAQGVISLVVPSSHAWEADEWMRAIRLATTEVSTDEGDRANAAALVAAGVARLEPREGYLQPVRSRWGVAEPTPDPVPSVSVSLQDGRWHVGASCGSCSAPEAWRQPAVEAPEDWPVEVVLMEAAPVEADPTEGEPTE